MIGIMSAASIVVVMMSISSVPDRVDVVRSSLMLNNPLLDLTEPHAPLQHLMLESDTGVSVVNLFTAEALIASHEGLARHVATGTVDWFFVVVVCHDVFLSRIVFGSTPLSGERFTLLPCAYFIRYATDCQASKIPILSPANALAPRTIESDHL